MKSAPAVFAAAILLLVTARPSASQDRRTPPVRLADSSVARIMAEARIRFPEAVINDVLRERTRPYPRAKRDALADSVIALAIRTNDALAAVTAIAGAGVPRQTANGGTPDPRALDWLIRIHRDGQDYLTRSAALFTMTIQVDPLRAVPYLRRVAAAQADSTAWLALDQLIVLAAGGRAESSVGGRQAVLAELRQMWDDRVVTDERAMISFARFASAHRWPFPAGVAGPPPLDGHDTPTGVITPSGLCQ